MVTLHLRAETKAIGASFSLTPSSAKTLVEYNGFTVFVEKSALRIFDDSEFEATGVTIVEEGSWKDTPKDRMIIGLEELPEN